MKVKKFIIFFVLISFLLVSCNQDEISNQKIEPQSENGLYLGTVVDISIYDKVDKDIFKTLFKEIEDIENKMSLNIESSEINKINKAAGDKFVKVSEDTFKVIKKGKEYSALTKGHFDITIGPLVELWQIGTENAKVPKEKEIKNALALINYKNIELNEEDMKVKLKKQNMKLDLGGIAKGYAADKLADTLKENDINHAIINLGGNVLALGSKPDGSSWKIGVQNPFEPRGKHVAIASVENKTVVSSGVYERNFTENGKLYHHILNPFTGFPVDNNLESVTIIADSSFDADGLSTGIFALGLIDGLEFVETLDGIDAVFITDKKEVYISSDIKKNIEMTNNEFKLAN